MVLFIITRNIPRGGLGFEGWVFCQLPPALYQWDFPAVIGFHSPQFYSADYFPMIPWFFLYCAGYFLWGILSESPRAKKLLTPDIRPLSFLGRHSLVIYLAHQPVLMGIFLLLGQLSVF